MNTPNACSTHRHLSGFSLADLMLLSLSERVHLCEIVLTMRDTPLEFLSEVTLDHGNHSLHNEQLAETTNCSIFVLYYVF